MGKFKIIEEGRLSNSEMQELVGGLPAVCGGPADGYNKGDIPGICDFEIKKQMTPAICSSTPNLSYGCSVFSVGSCYNKYGPQKNPENPSVCGVKLGIIPT